jgi:hypothetical protein
MSRYKNRFGGIRKLDKGWLCVRRRSEMARILPISHANKLAEYTKGRTYKWLTDL